MANLIHTYRQGKVANRRGLVYAKHFMQVEAIIEWQLFEKDHSWWAVVREQDYDEEDYD